MKTRIYRPTPANLRRLALALQRGELVAVPSETVYGLAADALNPAACAAIYAAKQRPADDPLIVHLHRLAQARQLTHWHETAEQLARAFWPGPLTLILAKQAIVPDITTSGLPSVAVRMPRHPVFRALLRAVNRPLAAPSANPFGYISPTSSTHVLDGLGGRIPAILEGGDCPIGIESTIVDLRTPGQAAILRPGAISAAELLAVLGPQVSVIETRRPRPHPGPAVAPGLLARHYSPRTPLRLHDRLPRRDPGAGEAFVYFAPPGADREQNERVFVLAPNGDGKMAAQRLFALLRQLDGLQLELIRMELAPATDPLAPALNDRLRRAAAR